MVSERTAYRIVVAFADHQRKRGVTVHDDIKIAIVNSNEIEGEGLRRILTDRQLNVAACCRTVASLTVSGRDSGVTTLVVVTASTDAAGLEVCRDVRTRWPWVKIIVMAASCASDQVAAAFREGVDGYVSKDISCASLAQTIRLVALGEKAVPSQVVFELAERRADPWWAGAEMGTESANISDREVEILKGLVDGEPNKVISRRLGIREATVKVHVKSILRKLHVMNRTQAAIWALSRGIGREAEQVEPAARDARVVPIGSARPVAALQ